MIDKTATMKFKIPANSEHPDAGKTLEGIVYEFEQCETAEEAQKLAEEKGWSLLDFVNETLQNTARQGKYQNQLALYMPKKELDPAALRATLIRTYIKAGLSEAVATAQVDSVLSQNNG